MKYPLRIISLHDIHLGHEITPTENIIERLERYVFNPSFLMGVDMILYAGDELDHVLLNSDPRVGMINLYHWKVLELASKLNIKIRLLKGTPSHDGDQGCQFEKIASLFPNVDFKYIDDMVIEYIKDFDMTIMYVPDEWGPRDQMYLQAKHLLEVHELEQVDLILGHNQFGYQFAEDIRSKISSLDEEAWTKMVKHHALFGHVHKRSTYKKIEVAGSFDRLAHGEEDPKGFLDITYRDEHDTQVTFIENKDAEVFKSIHLDKRFNPADVNDIKKLHQEVASINRESGNIRFVYHNSQLDMKSLLAYFRVQFPQYRYTTKFVDKKEKAPLVIDVTQKQEEVYIPLNAGNIKTMTLEYIEDDHLRERISKLMDDYLSKCK